MSLQSVVRNSNPEELNSASVRAKAVRARMLVFDNENEAAPLLSSSAEEKGPTEGGDSLEEAGRDEQEYVRRRLRDELGREPSEEEVKEWLRRHTEGY